VRRGGVDEIVSIVIVFVIIVGRPPQLRPHQSLFDAAAGFRAAQRTADSSACDDEDDRRRRQTSAECSVGRTPSTPSMTDTWVYSCAIHTRSRLTGVQWPTSTCPVDATKLPENQRTILRFEETGRPSLEVAPITLRQTTRKNAEIRAAACC